MDSLVNKLKNKVTYTLHEAVTDPNADQFAKEQKKNAPPPAKDPVEEDDKDYFDTTGGDPNSFDMMRLLKKTGNQMVRIVKKGFIPLVVLILSMYVANEMIMYSPPIRLIFFIFTFLICYSFKPFMVILVMYYLFKWGYSYYINELSKGPKVKILPTIFALLPLSTAIPDSGFGAFFMYPFTYPKNDADAIQLPIIMKDYQESLKTAFVYYDKVKDLPFIAEGFKALEEEIEHLHDIPPKPKEEEAPMPAVLEEKEAPMTNVLEEKEAPMVNVLKKQNNKTQALSANNQSPPVYNQSLSANNQSPPANNQSPSANNQSPPAYNQAPSANNQAPSANQTITSANASLNPESKEKASS